MLNFIKKMQTFILPPVYIVDEKGEGGIDPRLVSYIDKESLIAEQFKVLRTNLYSLSPGKPLKSIVITSAQAQEGKSTTAANLAFTLSLDKSKKTILVDCDLRRPSLHNLFGISRKPGFSEVLQGNIEIEHFLEKPALEDLFIIPSGQIISSPSEILNSPKIQEAIEKLKAKFDFVIFDTPPVLNVTDSSILGAISDAVFLVVKAGVTPKEMVEEAFNSLRDAQAKPKGCIITNFTIPHSAYYLSKYKYYYKYSYTKR